MNRGAAHQDIFRSNSDRQLFLHLWSRAVARFDLEIVSFCLMGNHFHFLVVSTTGQLSRALQFVLQTYTQRFNARHGRDGALFRGRFHSVLVDSDAYFERVGRYIELNPVAAGLVPLTQLETYPWSSFQYYAAQRRSPAWLSTWRILERYTSPHQYVTFVQSELSDRELTRFYEKPLRPTVVLGRDQFARRVQRTLVPGAKVQSGLTAVSIDEIETVLCNLSGCPTTQLQTNTAGRFAMSRRVAAQLANMLTHATLEELALRYGYPSPAAAGVAIRTTRASSDSDLRTLRQACLTTLGLDQNGHPLPKTRSFGV